MDLSINGQPRPLPEGATEPDMPLLWVLRDVLGMTGTKFGCGVSACGACTVHVDGKAVRSCVVPLSAAVGKSVRTIEALGTPGEPHVLQKAWIAHQVSQCGYCQSGMLMAAAALIEKNSNPSDADIDAAITNICRCGTYPRVREAIKTAARELRGAIPDGKTRPERLKAFRSCPLITSKDPCSSLQMLARAMAAL
ncbi:MAG: (2Fe-2S)-binding protein [Burkholderiales bacterium]|nr:(2Fe-2S)-binding protein [Burkholderiales bacterium]